MRSLTASEMLLLWDRGAGCHPLDRSALLAAAAHPELAPDAVADLPLGVVTDSQLALRIETFGPRIAGHVDCPRCGERLEIGLDAAAILGSAPAPGAGREIEIAGRRLRGPCLRDLAAVAGEADPHRAARRLAGLCTLAGGEAGLAADELAADELADDELADDELAAIETALEDLDPHARIAIRAACVACGAETVAELDVAALLWEEIASCARRLLGEVHRLAAAYGWSEAEILRLSPARRAGYLAMVGP